MFSNKHNNVYVFVSKKNQKYLFVEKKKVAEEEGEKEEGGNGLPKPKRT